MNSKSTPMLVFEERGKPEYPEKNLVSEQSRVPTNSAHFVSYETYDVESGNRRTPL